MHRAACLAMLVCVGCASAPRKAEELDPTGRRTPYQLHRSLAYTLLRLGRHAQAIAHIQPLIRGGLKTAEPHYLMGRALLGLRLYREAEKELRRAVDLGARFAPAPAMLGVLLDLTGDHRGAERAHRRAIQLDGASASYRNNLGFALYLQGRYAEAVKVLRAAIERDPTLLRAHNNLGFALAKLGELDTAERHFRLGGDEAVAANNLGFVREARGELRLALAQYQRALEADPSLSAARSNLARVCQRLGRPVPAPPRLPEPRLEKEESP